MRTAVGASDLATENWDPSGPALDLFDAFGAKEKTLHAKLGGHTGVPWFEVDAAARFFARHLN